jgi:hypothetical protein
MLINKFFNFSRLNNIKLCYLFNELINKTYQSDNYIENIFKNNIKKIKNLKQIENKLKKINKEIEKYNKKFPFYMNYSLVYVPKYNNLNIFQKIKNCVKNSIKNNFFSKKIKKIYNKSDLKIIINDLNTSYENILFNIMFSNNPLIYYPFELINKIHFKSFISEALEIYNRNNYKQLKIKNQITINFLEKSLQKIFYMLLYNFYYENIYFLNQISSKGCISFLNAINKDKKMFPIFVELPTIYSAEKINNKMIIKFKINTIEANLIDNSIENNLYLVEINQKTNLNYIEKFGHNLFISNIQRIENKINLI